MKRFAVALSIAATLVAAGLAAHDHVAAQDRVDTGRREFVNQGCHGCHTVGRQGTPIGPNLSFIGVKYPESYLKNWLRDPAMQRPSAHMPKLELTEEQIAALAAFLSSLKGEAK
jgi:mono/diheme cytochrome c family protein